MNFPIFQYKITIEYSDKIHIKDIEILNNPKTLGYSNEEITPALIEENLHDKLEELSKNFYSLIKEPFIIFSHKFLDKNNKIHFLKEMLYLIDQKENIYHFKGIAINISNEKEYEYITKTLEKSPHIGIIIYKNKIIKADEYTKKIFEIDDKIYEFSPIDLFPDNLKPKISNIVKRRLNGESFSMYHLFEIPSFKNKRKFIEFFSDTIIFQREYAGLVLGIDKTSFYKQKKLLEIESNINKVLSSDIFDLNELISRIILEIKKSNFYDEITFNKKLNYPSSYTLTINDNNKIIGKIYIYSKYENDFDEISIKILNDIENEINIKIKSINLFLTQLLLQEAVNKAFEWVLITDEKGKIIYINPTVEKLSLYSKKEILNQTPNIFKSDYHDKNFYKKLWDTITKGNIFESIIINKNKYGNLFYLQEKIIPISLPNGKKYFVALGIDITKEKNLENKIIDISFKDNLTSLLNREGFIVYSSEKIIRQNSNYALILIDIKDFHYINELIGHKKANLILKEFAHFLLNFFNNNPISRIGDDEFGILIEFKNKKEIEKHIKKLLKILNKIKFENLKLEVNIGIAIFPKDADNIETLLQKASIALERAKIKGNNTYEFFDSNFSNEIKSYISIKELLNEAIKNKEFIYYLQPYVDAKSFTIVGAESLIRIKRKNQIITPNVFIDYAEKTGLIKEIEKIMIKDIVNIIKELNIKISFNISGISLEDKTHINYIINNTKEVSNLLNIEITERELISELEKIKDTFQIFKKNNYSIAIDDFGTGYSSLNYIKHIPIDYLKIDMSFIKNIQNSQKDKAIVNTIINFAKQLNLKTIAEGIEIKEQAEILKQLGCDYLQGYYFGRPMSIEEFKECIKKDC